MLPPDLQARENALREKYREVWVAYRLGVPIEHLLAGRHWRTVPPTTDAELNLHVLFDYGERARRIRSDFDRYHRVLELIESGANKYRLKI